jgi:hypothetical protein
MGEVRNFKELCATLKHNVSRATKGFFFVSFVTFCKIFRCIRFTKRPIN